MSLFKYHFLPVLCLSLLTAQTATAEKFEFKHKAGDKFRIVSTTEQNVYLNGKLVQTSNILNRMASEVTNIQNGKATLNAVFDVAEELIDGNNAKHFQWGEEYSSTFTRDKLGKIVIDNKYYMPSARDIPLFPDRELNPGDSWISRGEEVFDLRHTFDITEPYRVPFRANNKYLGERERRNKKYKVFSITYNLLKDGNGFENAPRAYLSTKNNQPQKIPVKPEIKRISGKSTQIIYWDYELGQIAAAEDEYELKFELTTGENYVFRGKTISEIIEADLMDKENIARDVQEEIEKLELSDVSVKVVDEGISISLDNIQFAPDSSELLPSEKVKLDKISAILKKYQNRDILVAGHTALAGNSENSRIKLSKERAASVADYLIKENVRAPERIITRGYGSSRPVASNTIEEGRQKNRRVEITIMEN
jgi:outer membrane protein OmpA-like peptidoglycan-associated protein